MRKNYHKDVETAMLFALERYKHQRKLQKVFREALEAQTKDSETPAVTNGDKKTSDSCTQDK